MSENFFDEHGLARVANKGDEAVLITANIEDGVFTLAHVIHAHEIPLDFVQVLVAVLS